MGPRSRRERTGLRLASICRVTVPGLSCQFEVKEIHMRELTLLETVYLAGLLLCSLVLPLLASFQRSRDPFRRRLSMRTLWTGQAVIALAGLAILASAVLAPFAFGFGVLICVGFAFVLCRWFRAGPSAA